MYWEDLALDPEMIQDDGIHPTELAQSIIAERVKEFLLPVLRD